MMTREALSLNDRAEQIKMPPLVRWPIAEHEVDRGKKPTTDNVVALGKNLTGYTASAFAVTDDYIETFAESLDQKIIKSSENIRDMLNMANASDDYLTTSGVESKREQAVRPSNRPSLLGKLAQQGLSR